MGYLDTGRICLGASCKIQNRFYTYTRTPPVLKSKPNPALRLHERFKNTFINNRALYHEHGKLKLPVSDHTSVKFGSLFDITFVTNISMIHVYPNYYTNSLTNKMQCNTKWLLLAWNPDKLNKNENNCNEINSETGNSRHYHGPHLHVIYRVLQNKANIKLIAMHIQKLVTVFAWQSWQAWF